MLEGDIKESQGSAVTFDAIFKTKERTQKGIRRAFFDIGKELMTSLNEEVLRGKKTGRLYILRTRSGRRRRHIASAPGETPANITGKYRRSRGFINQTTQLTFGLRQDYAEYLEVGTRRMRARPGLGNAIEANERDIIRDFQDGILNEV